MSDPSATYIAKEVAVQRKPCELFHIWTAGGSHWRYTNGDVDVVYDSNTYYAAALKRGGLTKDIQLGVTSLQIDFQYLQNPILEYIALNPIQIIWISVMRLFRDQSPYEAQVIFVGHIKEVQFQGIQGSAKCVGFEHYLKKPIPRFRYQRQCNWTLFDTRCTVASASYSQVATVTALSSDLLSFECSGMTTQVSSYYTAGKVVFGEEERMITYYAADTNIHIRYKMSNLAVGSSVTLYAGCDGDIETCRDRFNNVINFGGTPYIPLDNPCLWTNL
jgi:uncharacterized phage protein (TIGR02218 family)